MILILFFLQQSKLFLDFCMWIRHMGPVPDDQLHLFVLQVETST